MGYADRDTRKRYARDWRAARRAQWISANGPCACGAVEDLDAKWIGEGKRPPQPWSWSQKRRDEMLSKCVVVCRRCREAGLRLSPDTQCEIFSLLIQGYGSRAVADILEISRDTVQKYLQTIKEKLPSCRCGKEAGHGGRCWFRVSAASLGKGPAYLEELRQIQYGRNLINRVRAFVREKKNA